MTESSTDNREPLKLQFDRLKTHLHWILECSLTLDVHRKAGKLTLDPSIRPGLNHELDNLIDSAQKSQKHVDEICKLLEAKADQIEQLCQKLNQEVAEHNRREVQKLIAGWLATESFGRLQ